MSDHLKTILMGFMSRKFIMTAVVMIELHFLPTKFKEVGVSDMVTLAVIGIIGAIATSYHVANVKDAANDKVGVPPSV